VTKESLLNHENGTEEAELWIPPSKTEIGLKALNYYLINAF
jgi:hypothetical protein